MNETAPNISKQLAELVRSFQEKRTGHAPKSVSIALGEDMLVVTLHDALTPAEKALAQSADGAARVQEFHRQLFANSSDDLIQEIIRITGRKIREGASEIDPVTGAVIHLFATGAMVQIFQLESNPPSNFPTPDLRDDQNAIGRFYKE